MLEGQVYGERARGTGGGGLDKQVVGAGARGSKGGDKEGEVDVGVEGEGELER